MFKALVKSVAPVGRDLNFDESSAELHVHNDVHTLLNIKKKMEDANVINAFLSRMQQPNVDVSDVPSGNRFCLGFLTNCLQLSPNWIILRLLRMMLRSKRSLRLLKPNTIKFVRNTVFNLLLICLIWECCTVCGAPFYCLLLCLF